MNWSNAVVSDVDFAFFWIALTLLFAVLTMPSFRKKR